jgi:hypothetical protein
MGMKLPFRTLVCLWLSVWTAVAPAIPPADLAAVVAARKELGERGWSAAIEIDNRRPGRPYPQETCALAFEFMDALWFYCPVDGARALSRFQHRVADDRAAILPLL